MTMKCYFATSGRLQVLPIYSPASCFDVCGDDDTIKSGIYARLQQLHRHLWGSLDFAYGLRMMSFWFIGNGTQLPSTYFQDFRGLRDLPSVISTWIRQSITMLFVLYSIFELFIWVIHVSLITALNGLVVPAPPSSEALAPVSVIANLYWSFLSGSTATPKVHPYVISVIQAGQQLQLVLIGIMMLMFAIHAFYYYWNTEVRWRLNNPSRTPGASGDVHPTLGKRPASIAGKRHAWRVVDGFMYPIVAVVAVLMMVTVSIQHLWTDKLVYIVAAKPVVKKQLEEDVGGDNDSAIELLVDCEKGRFVNDVEE
ncbi:UNVERIFIED_CONTAM: hypothetical protein HDU68_003966 [Siphonaria sp. JEL0065]|nr:hypothetical protein HDU68_003966 [Siphonaria sp. JEL0065]